MRSSVNGETECKPVPVTSKTGNIAAFITLEFTMSKSSTAEKKERKEMGEPANCLSDNVPLFSLGIRA